jgi:hypothetical protein|tara:strand:+ start:298 stop:549 length:252 start_codon:yes stop_codon:yes gene_type:complete
MSNPAQNRYTSLSNNDINAITSSMLFTPHQIMSAVQTQNSNDIQNAIQHRRMQEILKTENNYNSDTYSQNCKIIHTFNPYSNK